MKGFCPSLCSLQTHTQNSTARSIIRIQLSLNRLNNFCKNGVEAIAPARNSIP